MKKKSALSIFLFLCCIYSNAQQYFFSGYSISDGLSQSVVNCIFQDSKGYIWFGSQNGLNKYNGYSFEVFTYNPSDSNSIANNWINGIAEDKEANLWIATKGGLVKYNRKEKRRYPSVNKLEPGSVCTPFNQVHSELENCQNRNDPT